MRTYIGIDNGVSGSIGIITPTQVQFIKTPTVTELDYTKEKKNVTRIDFQKLIEILSSHSPLTTFVALERPMVNPGRWVATMSAIRCHEVTLVALQLLKLPYCYIDSKEWQKELLPKNCEKLFLKSASLDIGNRLYPQFEDFKHLDRDGLLIATYCKRKNL